MKQIPVYITLTFYFKQDVAILTLNAKLWKLVDLLIKLSCCISSTNNDVDIHTQQAEAAFGWLPVIWKSDLSDKIKQKFFQANSHVSTTVWLHHKNSNETVWEKALWELHKNAMWCFKRILEAVPHGITAL